MRVLNDDKSPAAAGGAIEEGRRPTMVAAPAAASPELLNRPVRRTFTARDKLRILAEIDTARATPGGIGPGGIGAVLRREGLYSSALSDWRRQRDAGAFAALRPVPRGPKTAPLNPLAAEHARLLRDNKRLTQRLERAEAIIDLQKKVAALLGLPIASDEGL
jgi:transposase-like protein